MNDFEELKAPEQNSKGWYISIKNSEDYGTTAWLTTTGVISGDVGNMDILHYVSEEAALVAARQYYQSFGLIYGLSLDSEFAMVPVIIDGQQVMEFE